MVETESQEELQEKLKNMSPEEQRNFQKQNCIFCQIILGKVKSKKIYEDEKCIAILDINPANQGHVLLLPKEHYSVMPQIPESDIGHMFIVSKAISSAILKGLKVSGTNIFVANGVAAGQRAQHFMIHIIPRKENDGIISLRIPQRQIPDSDLEMIKKGMAEIVARTFGIGAKRGEIKDEIKAEEKAKEQKKENKGEGKTKEQRKGYTGESGAKLQKNENKKEKQSKPDLDNISGLFR